MPARAAIRSKADYAQQRGRVRARHRQALAARRPARAAGGLREPGAPLQWRRGTKTGRRWCSTRARRRSRNLLLRPRTNCACTRCTRPTKASCAPFSASGSTPTVAQSDGFASLQSRTAAADAPRRGADRPALRARSPTTPRCWPRCARRWSDLPIGGHRSGCRSCSTLESQQLPQRLKSSRGEAGAEGLAACAADGARADARGFGLLGSSVFVVNPPHTLHDTLAAGAALAGRGAGPVRRCQVPA